jgi:hypothetical protein
MSLVAESPAVERTADRIVWSSPETKLWVGSRSGEYAGMIEYSAGHFVVTGRVGQPLGSCSDLNQAMSVAESGRTLHRLPEALLSNVALASAAVAVSVAGLSITMIAA